LDIVFISNDTPLDPLYQLDWQPSLNMIIKTELIHADMILPRVITSQQGIDNIIAWKLVALTIICSKNYQLMSTINQAHESYSYMHELNHTTKKINWIAQEQLNGIL
jgi:hypothetical protein